MDFKFSSHARLMIRERSISEEWVQQTINFPDRTEVGKDKNVHYIKVIPEHGGRFLHVVVNTNVTPKRIITVFFDRRLRKQS